MGDWITKPEDPSGQRLTTLRMASSSSTAPAPVRSGTGAVWLLAAKAGARAHLEPEARVVQGLRLHAVGADHSGHLSRSSGSGPWCTSWRRRPPSLQLESADGSDLAAAVDAHELAGHQLLSGAPVNREAFLPTAAGPRLPSTPPGSLPAERACAPSAGQARDGVAGGLAEHGLWGGQVLELNGKPRGGDSRLRRRPAKACAQSWTGSSVSARIDGQGAGRQRRTPADGDRRSKRTVRAGGGRPCTSAAAWSKT